MTIVCEISAKDLLSQLNFFFRSNWIPSKNSINIHFSSYFYSIQAAGIGLWGFAKEIAGDLLKSKLTSFKHSSDAVEKKFLIHIKSDWQTFFLNISKLLLTNLWNLSWSRLSYDGSPFLRFCGIVCKISAKNSLSLLKFLSGGNSMLAKNSIKAARGLAFISVHTLIFNVRDSDWFAGFADWMAGDFLS